MASVSAWVGARPCSDSKRSTRWSMAALKNMARMVGAGPLMVIDTEVVGIAQVEPVEEGLHVVEGGDGDPRRADLAVDVGPLVGIEAVERHRVEGGGQAGGRLSLGQQVEPPIGAEGVSLAGEHPGRVLAVPLEREHPGGEGEVPGQVLGPQPADQVAMVVARGRATRGIRVPDREVRHGVPALRRPGLVLAVVPVGWTAAAPTPRAAGGPPDPARPRSGRPARRGRRCRSRGAGRGDSAGHLLGLAGLDGQAARWFRGSRDSRRRSRPGSGADRPGRWLRRGSIGGRRPERAAPRWPPALRRSAGPSADGRAR